MNSKIDFSPIDGGQPILKWQFDLFVQASQKIVASTGFESVLRVLAETALEVMRGTEANWGVFDHRCENFMEFYKPKLGWQKSSQIFPLKTSMIAPNNIPNIVRIFEFDSNSLGRSIFGFIPLINGRTEPVAFLQVYSNENLDLPLKQTLPVLQGLSDLGSKAIQPYIFEMDSNHSPCFCFQGSNQRDDSVGSNANQLRLLADRVQARKVIESQQKWLETILDTLKVPVFFLEPGTGHILFSNRVATKLGPGVVPRDIPNSKWSSDSRLTDENDQTLTLDQIPSIRAARGENLNGVPFVWHTPAMRYSFLVDAEFLQGKHGHPSTILMVYRDVTKLKEAEDKLHAAIIAHDEFLTIASHQLKTPLTPIKLQTDNLKLLIRAGKSDKITPEKISKVVDLCNDRIIHLTSIIEDILDVSRITRGHFRVNLGSCDLAEIIHGVVDGRRESASRANCKMTLDISSPVVGNFDRQRIEQALGNIMTNAIKYSPGNNIKVTLTRNHEIATISVEDNGVGIPKEDLFRIFYRFERVNGDQRIAGLGLGLFVARSIVEAHRGKIWVHSELKRGSTFFIELPLLPKLVRRIQ